MAYLHYHLFLGITVYEIVSGHSFGTGSFFREPPPTVCAINQGSSFVYIGDIFEDRTTCTVSECVENNGLAELQFRRQLCKVMEGVPCLEPGKTWTDSLTCAKFSCSESAEVKNLGPDDNCERTCTGCIVIDRGMRKCIPKKTWYYFPSGEKCLKRRCNNKGNHSKKSRPANAWRPIAGSYCIKKNNGRK